jgi:DNA topoisomerase-1
LSSRFLVITEKPSSARKIAHALDDQKSPRKEKYGKVSYYLAKHKSDELVIVSAVGHLYSIDQVGSGWNYPVFDIKWIPTYKQNKRTFYTKQYLDTIVELSKDVDSYVSACDNDQEGSLIAYNIINHGVGEHALNKSRRMLYSSLTTQELVSSWKNMPKSLDYHVIAAGKTRHEVDWLFGINLSRALTLAARRNLDSKKVLSIGRVQGPTLKFIYDLELRIKSFVPIPYWKVTTETAIDGENYSFEYEKPKIKSDIHAKKITKDCREKMGIIKEVNSEELIIHSPSPFNLGDLQQEAYKHFKMNPSYTLDLAEKLYYGGYISYPRTESNKIPSTIDIKGILEKLSTNTKFENEIRDLLNQKRYKSRKGKRDDHAHPAIHPTGQKPIKLKQQEERVYDLIVRRFLVSLGKPMIKMKTDIVMDVNSHLFNIRGVITKEEGWSIYYGEYYKSKDHKIPLFSVGQKIFLTNLTTRRLHTKSNPRYNASSLIKKMEQEKIGTKATRSKTIETLYRRGYIKGKQISMTSLGEKIIETLIQYNPKIIQVKLTRDLEEELGKIELGKLYSDKVFNDTVETLKPILIRFKENEKKIGLAISNKIQVKDNQNDKQCKVCFREKIEDSLFCKRHNISYENIKEGFFKWRLALGYQWIDYLEKVANITGIGECAKEVIDKIMT